MADDFIPDWFDRTLLDIYNKKRDRSLMRKRDRTLDALMRNLLLKPLPDVIVDTRKHDWDSIECMIEIGCADIRIHGFEPDVVVGIKSGGAFIAKYVAEFVRCSGFVDYMRVSHYSDKTRSVARSITEVNREAQVTEETSIDLTGLKVLLVDDQTATGSSLIVGKRFLEDKGAAEVKTFCLYAKKRGLADFSTRKGLGVYFPWGKDA